MQNCIKFTEFFFSDILLTSHYAYSIGKEDVTGSVEVGLVNHLNSIMIIV